MTNVVDSEDKALTTLETWHRRLGHCNNGQIQQMTKHCEGLEINNKNSSDCQTCATGKIKHRKTSRPKKYTKREPGELIHTDGLGPITPEAEDGSRHVHSYIDDATRWTFSIVSDTKTGQIENMKRIRSWMLNQADRNTG